MNQELELKTWEEFVDFVKNLYREIDESRRSERYRYYSPPLFRGHADAGWKLETTLERKALTADFHRAETMASYQEILSSAHRYLSGFSDLRYPFDASREASYDEHKRLNNLPNYEFMAYMRHHGFPSPLLDWTTSPFIAAYFAFDSDLQPEKVAIFAYREMMGSGKATSSAKPQIFVAGPWTSAHRRHHLQQSWYTICFEKSDKEMKFISYEARYDRSSFTNFFPQDVLQKITLPASERNHALKELNRMNINAYSLFQSEESLARTVGNKLFFQFE